MIFRGKVRFLCTYVGKFDEMPSALTYVYVRVRQVFLGNVIFKDTPVTYTEIGEYGLNFEGGCKCRQQCPLTGAKRT